MTQTPNYPGLHNPALFGPVGAVPDAQQWILTISALTEYFIGEIAIAFGGISILGWQPFAFLQTWGENLVNQAQEAFDGQQTANANLATLLDGIMGTGHTFSDLASFLSAAASLASTVNSEFSALLSGLGAGNVTGLVSYLSAAAGNATSAAQSWADALAGASVEDAEALGAAVAGAANAATSAATQIGQIVTNSLEADAAAVGAAVNAAKTNAQGMIDTLVQAAQNDESLINQTVDAAKAQLVSWLSSAPQQLQGFVGVFGVADFAAALGAHKANTTATQALAASVASALNATPSPSGTDVTVDFTQMPDQPDMSGVMLPGNGAISISGGQAVQGTSNIGDIQVFPTQCTSDYVVIEATLGQLFDLAKTPSADIFIIGRCDSARNTFTGLFLGNTGSAIQIAMAADVSGVLHYIKFINLSSVAPGGVLKVIMGDPVAGNPYVYEVLYNGQVVLGPVTDASHFSILGAGQRYVGLCMFCAVSGKFPPGIEKVRYYDNAPSAGARPFAQLPPNNPLTPGGLYIPSDTGLILRDDGTSWDRVMGGPLTAFTPPPSTGWTTTNLGTATISPDKDARLLTLPGTVGAGIRAEYSTLSPASGYAWKAYIEPTYLDRIMTGMVLTDGTKYTVFGQFVSSTNIVELAVLNYSAVNGSTTVAASQTLGTNIATMPNWLRIRDDGANKYFEFSLNGVDWQPLYAVSRTTFLTATAIGWGGEQRGSTQAFVRCRSFGPV
ncbi:hypothetical protein [Mycobacterium palustre]|uniref:hypothetical protein n=2 Tax=Mycobacterium palustre TaxID=153971 RepID=UPI0021F372C0|nr:hypothetical protein [Mycobacterium palustre]MCV7100967.1 hypothetical protein [Mycobacterium palustre]